MLCQTTLFAHTTLMRTSQLFTLLPLSCLTVMLSNCGITGGGTTGRNPGGTGPFDKNGNYVEAWADNPSKWGKRNSSPIADDVPAIASNEQPPSNAVPLSDSKPLEHLKSSSKPVRTAELEVASRQKPKSNEIVSRPKTKVSAESASTKSKPKVVAKTTKPKPSASSRYVVKKGDSLSLIASRNKTSVSALQKANGISGTLIQPGKSLVIPR
jgi:LysM repeat protein